MSKLIELKYTDALTNLYCHIIFNCDDVSIINIEHNKDESAVCLASIVMRTGNNITINFINNDVRAQFLDKLANKITTTKSDCFCTIEF